MRFHGEKERFVVAFEVASRFGFNAYVREVVGAEDARIELLRLGACADRFDFGSIAERLDGQDAHRFGPEIAVKDVSGLRGDMVLILP